VILYACATLCAQIYALFYIGHLFCAKRYQQAIGFIVLTLLSIGCAAVVCFS